MKRNRRIWYQQRGEQPLLLTFWPQEYRRGNCYTLAGQRYRITRYVHAEDYRFFEVWGRAVEQRGPTGRHPADSPPLSVAQPDR
jgi:hypothetical protein